MSATATFNQLASRNYSALARVSSITSHLASTRSHVFVIARLAAYERQIDRLSSALHAPAVETLPFDELDRLTALVEEVLGSTGELTRLVLTASASSSAFLRGLYQRLAARLNRACRPLAAKLDALHLSIHEAEGAPADWRLAFRRETVLPLSVQDHEAFAAALLRETPNERLRAASERYSPR